MGALAQCRRHFFDAAGGSLERDDEGADVGDQRGPRRGDKICEQCIAVDSDRWSNAVYFKVQGQSSHRLHLLL